MAGYSGTPLPKKLGIKQGSRVALVSAPEGFEAELEPLPEGAELTRRLDGDGLDVVLLFVTERDDLEQRFLPVARQIHAAGGLWVAWPKKSAKVPTDVDQSVVMEIGLATGLVDNKVCAVTDVWSGLRFVVRLTDRADWPPAAD
ncbi:MAG: DUF3052 domain-containing protein [Actinomycetota bacterium]|nr:DUF3052 domain-containing protein [Actinomycetota bacterium]